MHIHANTACMGACVRTCVDRCACMFAGAANFQAASRICSTPRLFSTDERFICSRLVGLEREQVRIVSISSLITFTFFISSCHVGQFASVKANFGGQYRWPHLSRVWTLRDWQKETRMHRDTDRHREEGRIIEASLTVA